MHIKDSRKLDAAAWEGKVDSCSGEKKYYRVWNPKTHRVVKRKNATFIVIPTHLLLSPSELSPLQYLISPFWDLDGDTLDKDYISYDDLLRDVRDYTGVLDFTANILTNHENTSGVSADPQVQGLVDQIRDLTRKYLLTSAVPLPGAASLVEPLPRAAGESSSEGTSPPSGEGASPQTEELLPVLVPFTARRGTAMRNNRVTRSNVVTRHAAVELTGAVSRYRRIRPDNNNDHHRNNNNNNSSNNHAAPMELFQPSTLQKLR